MNDSDRRELENLKQRQKLIEEHLANLASDIRRVELRISLPHIRPPADKPALATEKQTPAVSEPVTPPPILPPIPPVIEPHPEVVAQNETAPSVPETPKPTKEFVPDFVFQDRAKNQPPREESIPVPPLISTPAPENEVKPSFEMRLGTYWLVRIGAVLILTGLVFFGNLAYQKLGAGGKIALLYLASGLLLGAGAWWQRKSVKESLHNYAQVLFGGGLAAVYFTTYAAHHVANLRVIESALVDGALLLGWAGFMAWIADRRKSELLALFATGLAYYTSIITPVSGFTLYSNLVLTIAAVVFLVRNRWAGLSWACLVATYASYVWWRFFHGGEGWRWATADEGLGFSASFLFSYWIVFTIGVFLSKEKNIAGARRAAFLTFNNGALFSLVILTMFKVNAGHFWQFCIGFGSTLLVLAELARRFLPTEPVTKNTYLTQGLVLVTLGIVSHYTGTQLALVLAAESVILFILGTLRKNIFLQTGAYISGAMSVGWGIDSLERDNVQRLVLGAMLGGLMTLNACWSAWRRLWADKREVRPEPFYFMLLALTMWVATTWHNTTTANFPLALAFEAVVLTATIYVLRVREIALMGQFLLVLGHICWLARFIDPMTPPVWWNPLLLIGITLGLSHWWQRQKTIELKSSACTILKSVYAVALVAVTLNWLAPEFSPGGWLVLTSALALGVTAYGIATRLWPLAACAQIFLLVSCTQFFARLAMSKPDWYFPLAPVAALSALSFATWRWFAQKPESSPMVREPLLRLALVYRWVALVMTICWVNKYIPEGERAWVFALLGAGAFAIAGWRRNREAVLFSAAFMVTSLGALWMTPTRDMLVYLPNFLVALVLLAQQQFIRKCATRYEMPLGVQSLMIATGTVTLWWLVSQWVLQGAGGFYLTASWSLLAFAMFGCGVLLKEKVYRWVGLGILGAALGRIVIFDVWKLETLYRVLSFMALGFVLVVLGFIYNKYQEKIREWL